MGIKSFRPKTHSLRFKTVLDYKQDLTTDKPYKPLLEPKQRISGRNSYGQISVRHRGGGNKRAYRIIDFKRDKSNIPAKVETIEYDPNRSAFIALLCYADGERRYILQPIGLKVGMSVVAGNEADILVGNALPLRNIPLGTTLHNIELRPGQGGMMARSAGSYAQLTSRDGKYGIVKLPSGETRMILITCMATIGTVSNADHSQETLGKAGRKRWMGRRPRVRGVAMNPVDHPMGGGEGKSSGGHPRSRKGLLSKGKKTRNKNKYSEQLIVNRAKK